MSGPVLAHPSWCDLRRCTAATIGEHRSLLVAVPAAREELWLDADLVCGVGPDSPPAVEVYVYGRYAGFLLPATARTAGRILGDLGRGAQ